MAKSHFYRVFRTLLACTVSVAALGMTSSHANEDWNVLQIVDMTNAADLSGDVVVTTGFLEDFDIVSYDQPLNIAPNGLIVESAAQPRESGWAGLVEVEMDDDIYQPISQVTAFSDRFAESEREKRMSGFYTMRYQFETDLPFRPYAGAGLGLVASESATDTAGVIAGRAMAGFDLTVDEQSAIFAEYAYVKSGGASFGLGGTGSADSLGLPDTEHTLKLGFRRTF